jgi:hypothetical protein
MKRKEKKRPKRTLREQVYHDCNEYPFIYVHMYILYAVYMWGTNLLINWGRFECETKTKSINSTQEKIGTMAG